MLGERKGDPCAAARERILEHGTAAGGSHVEACASCRAFAASAEALGRALAAVPRRPAPIALDGRVVAALQAGHRQERAVGQVSSLEGLEAPEALSRGLDRALSGGSALPRHPAPAVLERLVREELADPVAARARRHLGALPRRAAPEELRKRLERDLARRAGPRRRGARVGLTLAAVVLALVGAARLLPTSEPTRRQLLPLEFEIVRGASPADLSPMARAFAPVLVPGKLAERREERR